MWQPAGRGAELRARWLRSGAAKDTGRRRVHARKLAAASHLAVAGRAAGVQRVLRDPLRVARAVALHLQPVRVSGRRSSARLYGSRLPLPRLTQQPVWGRKRGSLAAARQPRTHDGSDPTPAAQPRASAAGRTAAAPQGARLLQVDALVQHARLHLVCLQLVLQALGVQLPCAPACSAPACARTSGRLARALRPGAPGSSGARGWRTKYIRPARRASKRLRSRSRSASWRSSAVGAAGCGASGGGAASSTASGSSCSNTASSPPSSSSSG